MNYHDMKRLVKRKSIRGLNNIIGNKNIICGDCIVEKQPKTSYRESTQNFTRNCLELIHKDLVGPTETTEVYVCLYR